MPARSSCRAELKILRARRTLLALSLALLVAACGSAPSPSRARTEAAAPNSSASVGQTETEWGRIWDALPAGFPRYPGATPADDASAAASSGRYAVSAGDAKTIAAWLQGALEAARFSTDVSGALEDGSFMLDSVGAAGCQINTTVAPLGGMTFVTVLYGAGCPMP